MAKCGTSNKYPPGQCTVYADQRYHDLTGCFVPWSGNAWQWDTLARAAGWHVSDKPQVPSIMCLQGGVQGASALGHVGVVESINHDGSFTSSNLNWQPHPKQVTNIRHVPGKGVSFLSSSGSGSKSSSKGNTMATKTSGTLTFDQTAQLAYNSGFRGGSLVTIVAIAAAESGLDTQAQNLRDPFGGSWGILQINGSHFHTGGISKTDALDPQKAFNFAWGLSGGGTNFVPWGAFTNGSYIQFLSQAKTAAGHIKGVKSAPDPCWAGIKDGTPAQDVGACQPLNLQCFDPAQCASYIAGGLKVSAIGPAMLDTTNKSGTTCTQLDFGCWINQWFNTTFAAEIPYLKDPVRLVKIAIGVTLLIVVAAMLFTPEGQAVGQAVGRPLTKAVKTGQSYAKAFAK